MVGAPGTDIVTLTSRTLERTIFPPQHIDVGVTDVGTEKLVKYEKIGIDENPLLLRICL